MRIDLERATIIALEIQASQHAVCTGTSMYSKHAASAAAPTRAKSGNDDAPWALATPSAVVAPSVGRNHLTPSPRPSRCMARLSPAERSDAIGAGGAAYEKP